MEKSMLLQEQNKLQAKLDGNILYPSSQRRWELSYGGRDKFYLTDQERNELMKAVTSQYQMAQIGEMSLSTSFKYLIPVRPKVDPEVLAKIAKTKKELGLE